MIIRFPRFVPPLRSLAREPQRIWPHSENLGGLNGSLQHLLKVLLQGSTRLISFAGVDSTETKRCLGSE